MSHVHASRMFVRQALHFDTLVGTADYHTLVPVASVPKVKQPHTNLLSLPEKKGGVFLSELFLCRN